MKKKIVQLITLILPLTVLCQNEYLARLPISGGFKELGISPKEEIWVATKAGNVYQTKQIDQLWSLNSFGSFDTYNPIGQTFERINFFTEDTLMISGFIQENGKQDFVYWSGNHGKTWEKIMFGKSSWIDAACIKSNGKAWMSGSSQLIYYTNDFGRTWTEFDKVEKTSNLRFNSIHFENDNLTGLFGSTWNVIYLTKDNCKTWEKIPTPLNQNKYINVSKYDAPRIEKVRIFGDFYIINQQDKIFITRKDSIDWKLLNDVSDFEITEQSKIYTINRDLTVSLYDEHFNTIWHSDKKLSSFPIAISFKNNSLFALNKRDVYKISPLEFKSVELLTAEIPISEPYNKVSYKGNEYGFDINDILSYDEKKSVWYRYKKLDFPIRNIAIFDSKLIISDTELENYYSINEESKSIILYQLPKTLFESANNVISFKIETGSQGCFHSEIKSRNYTLKGKQFSLKVDVKDMAFLSAMPYTIKNDAISELIYQVDKSRFVQLKSSDFEFSNKDISDFKEFIQNEEQRIKKQGIDRFEFENKYVFPGEKTDFEFYRNIADSITYIPDSVINKIFNLEYGNYSTTTNWVKLTFNFKDGSTLELYNQDDKSNYLYSPWIANFKGITFKVNSIKVGRLIDNLTEGDLIESTSREKKYALFRIADYLYRQKIKNK